MASGHTPRSLKKLRESGDYYLVEKVERWQQSPGRPGGGVRQDLFGIIDILAIGKGVTMGVQVTSAGQFTAHLRSIAALTTEIDGVEYSRARLILEAGWRLEVHGWEKVGRLWKMTRYKELIL